MTTITSPRISLLHAAAGPPDYFDTSSVSSVSLYKVLHSISQAILTATTWGDVSDAQIALDVISQSHAQPTLGR